MKLSDLISELTSIQDIHGEVEVMTEDSEGYDADITVVLTLDEFGRAITLYIDQVQDGDEEE